MDINTVFSFLGACGSITMSYFGWRNLTKNKPKVTAQIRDLTYADHRGHKDEALQKRGFCLLTVSISPSTDDYNFSSIEIPHCQISSPILAFDGSFVKPSEERMKYGSIPFNMTAYANDSGIVFSLLIKPDAKEEADLKLVMRGHLLSSIRVPFHYQKTHYFGE